MTVAAPFDALARHHGRVAYRADIDGLRAIAVLAVVLFHAGLPGIAGGFVGVDVFFVISGYLITSILRADVTSGGFSLIGFYERRVRRILPALYLVLAATLVATLLFIDPQQAELNFKSIAAAAAFAANIYAWRNTSYFDNDAFTRPVVHIWSLSVEEQFYFAFPIFYVLLARLWPKALVAGLLLAAIGSLGLSFYLSFAAPRAGFYLPVGRAWELLIGSLLAQGVLPAVRHRLARSFGTATGLALIALSILCFDGQMRFPGALALIPCLGAALVIHCGQNNPVGRLLETRGMVATGLISYSLYLWHWPLLVFARYLNLGLLDALQTLAVVALSFALAALSTFYVERPIRRLRISRIRLFTIAGVATAFVMAVSLAGVATQGANFRGEASSPTVVRMREQWSEFTNSTCLTTPGGLPDAEKCRIGARDAPANAILLGDSHGGQLAPLIDEVGKEFGLSVDRLARGGCTPLIVGRFHLAIDGLDKCAAYNRLVLAELRARPAPKIVFIAGNWQRYVQQRRPAISGNVEGKPFEGEEYLSRALEAFAREMNRRGSMVILFGQTPLPDIDPIACRQHAAFNRISAARCTNFAAQPTAARDALANRLILDRVAHLSPDTAIVPLQNIFCDAQRCTTERGGESLYLDSAHFSPAGTMLIAPRLRATLTRLLDRRKARGGS